MKKFLANTHFFLNVFDTFARGDLVVHSRIDSNIHPDSVDTPYPMVGVFFMKGGKINEWYELMMDRRMKM
jgi:limonene-1,2-epoxide hydrolase